MMSFIQLSPSYLALLIAIKKTTIKWGRFDAGRRKEKKKRCAHHFLFFFFLFLVSKKKRKKPNGFVGYRKKSLIRSPTHTKY